MRDKRSAEIEPNYRPLVNSAFQRFSAVPTTSHRRVGRISESTSNGILVSDFDGTITRFDFYDLVSREFPEIAGDYWKRYEAGEISHFEALRLIFAGIRAPEETILAIVKAMQIEPRLAEAVALLEKHGWIITVASAGCSWYIERLLRNANVSLEVNPHFSRE